MGPLRQRLSHLHTKAVEIEVVAVAVGLEELFSEGTGRFTHGDRLHRQHIGW